MPVIFIGLGAGDNVNSGEGQLLAKEWGAYGYIEIQDTQWQNFENVLNSLSLGIITNYQNALKKPKRKFRFKIAVAGDVEVGKTSLIMKFTQNAFKRDYVKTIGAQFSVYNKEIEGDKIRLLFWDIAGGKAFHFLHQNFFHNSRAAIIVYGLEESSIGKKNIDHISAWYDEITKFCGDIPIIIIANKADLVDETKLDTSKIQEFVNKKKLLGFYLTSAKTGKGINEAFNRIIEELYSKYSTLNF